MGRLFGTDGVRGIANTELTCEMAYNLGRAGAYILTKQAQHAPKILVGMDTRISGGMLEAALVSGMCSVGATAVSLGVIPTPGIAYLVRKYNADAGVVISASHNPVQDNGIKFFNRDGYKLPDEMENSIEDIMLNRPEQLPRPTGAQVGKHLTEAAACDDYVAFLAGTMDGMDLKGLSIAVDCANGATFKAAPAVLKQLGATVLPIHNKPDGVNINANCGSTHIESLQEYVKKQGANIGLAFDGDGDRCLLVDELGNVVEGDEILSICANYLKLSGKLNKSTLVATIMSNLGLLQMGEKFGIVVEQTAVGDRYVLERMLEKGLNLGGEQSGHVIFLDYNTTGDGILTALQVLKVMGETGKTLSQLNQFMEVLPQVLINARVPNQYKNSYMESERVKKAIEDLQRKFAGEGRVLIRPSGTEPVVRVMIEGKDREQLKIDAEKLAGLLEEEFGRE